MLDKDMNSVVKNVLLQVASNSDFCIEVMETDKDHVHLLVSAPPKLSPLQIVRKLKQETYGKKKNPYSIGYIGDNEHFGQTATSYQR